MTRPRSPLWSLSLPSFLCGAAKHVVIKVRKGRKKYNPIREQPLRKAQCQQHRNTTRSMRANMTTTHRLTTMRAKSPRFSTRFASSFVPPGAASDGADGSFVTGFESTSGCCVAISGPPCLQELSSIVTDATKPTWLSHRQEVVLVTTNDRLKFNKGALSSLARKMTFEHSWGILNTMDRVFEVDRRCVQQSFRRTTLQDNTSMRTW
jgi:hypothetical protein